MFKRFLALLTPLAALSIAFPRARWPTFRLDEASPAKRHDPVLVKRQITINGPIFDQSFPGPSIIPWNGHYWIHATSGHGFHIQQTISFLFDGHTDKVFGWSNVESLTEPGTWSTGKDIWAPNVVELVSCSSM
jgi:hypothetical protein